MKTGSGAESSVWTKSGALLYISADRASTAGLGVHNTPSRPNPGHTPGSNKIACGNHHEDLADGLNVTGLDCAIDHSKA